MITGACDLRFSFRVAVFSKQHSHLFLRQPNGFILQPHIDADVAFFVLVYDDFAGVHDL